MTTRFHRTAGGSAVAVAASIALLLAGSVSSTAVAASRSQLTAPRVLPAAGRVAAHVVSPWTPVSAGAGVNIGFQPKVVRWGKKLVVVWSQQVGANTVIHSRVLDANGKPGPISTVASSTASTSDPAVLLLGGVPTVVYNGASSLVYAQSATATAWTPGPGSFSHDSAAYGLGAIDDGTGQPVTAFAFGSSDHVTVHHGIDPAVPATADFVTGGTGDAQQVSVARDKVTNAVYALWYSGAGTADQGVHAAQVFPTLAAPSAPAPLSAVTFAGELTSVNPGQDVAVTARVGGGIWAAYGSGYSISSTHKLVLWNVVTGRTLVLSRPSAGIQYVGVSAAPGGRLWVFWVESGTVYAVRTNPAVTRFGVVRAVVAPGGYSPTRTSGDGSLGFLDVVINQSNNGAPSVVSATRIYEKLFVTAKAGRRSIAVTVTDAGVPVSGATVTVGGVKKRTGATGRVSFSVSAGTHPVLATAIGFVAGTARVRVS